MHPVRKAVSSATVFLGFFLATPPSTGQISPYVYVEMSMGVPWFLYFVFLGCILLPFFVLIVLAWRRYYNAGKDGRDRHSNLEDL